MNKMYNMTMKTLRKQNKKFASITKKTIKPKKEEVEDKEKEKIEVNITVYYIIFWLIIIYLLVTTIFPFSC